MQKYVQTWMYVIDTPSPNVDLDFLLVQSQIWVKKMYYIGNVGMPKQKNENLLTQKLKMVAYKHVFSWIYALLKVNPNQHYTVSLVPIKPKMAQEIQNT